jgi:hypothetical protein
MSTTGFSLNSTHLVTWVVTGGAVVAIAAAPVAVLIKRPVAAS